MYVSSPTLLSVLLLLLPCQFFRLPAQHLHHTGNLFYNAYVILAALKGFARMCRYLFGNGRNILNALHDLPVCLCQHFDDPAQFVRAVSDRRRFILYQVEAARRILGVVRLFLGRRNQSVYSLYNVL